MGMEDRIHKNGKGPQLTAALNQFRRSNKAGNAQQNLYDTLVIIGATEEEADEFVNLMVEND